MTGYTVHTGASKKFVAGWDRIFSDDSSSTSESSGAAKSKSKAEKKSGAKPKKGSKTPKRNKSATPLRVTQSGLRLATESEILSDAQKHRLFSR